MKKFRSIVITIILLLLVSLPLNAMASEFESTRIVFKYLGVFSHSKEVDLFGGSAYFEIRGIGSGGGSHEARSFELSTEFLNIVKTHIEVDLAGATAINNAASIIAMEQGVIRHIELSREQDIAALNSQFTSSTTMTGEDFAKAMNTLNLYYDKMLIDVKNSYLEAKKNVRVISTVSIDSTDSEVTSNVGVEMDPGESGGIQQYISTTHNNAGEYTRVDNHFYNTGGTTKRELVVDGFINEQMRVEGYAEVWDSTVVRSGNAKTGWWDLTK